jgi:TRAP transporter TAXI family solute receptor
MSRATLIAIASGMVLCTALLAGALMFALRPTVLRIAVGPEGSGDARVVDALAQGFAADRHSVRLQPVATAGAAASAASLGAAEADLAVARADAALPKDARAVAVLRKDTVMIWVPNPGEKAAHGIKSIQALAGHRIGVVGRTEANAALLKLVLVESGVAPEKVEIVPLDPTDVAVAVRNQKVDALMAVGAADGHVATEAFAAMSGKGAPVFLPIGAADIIARKHPVYESSDIAAGALGAHPSVPDDDIKTLTVDTLIVGRKEVAATTMTAFTRQLFSVRHALQNQFPDVTRIEVPDTDKTAAVPAHPGAAAYVDGTDRTFLERNSDFIWFGIMVLSGVGSAGAWLRSTLRRGERARHAALRDRLVEMVPTARTCTSLTDLDTMQGEADQIFKEGLAGFADGAMGEDNTLAVFTVALDQVHNAINARRAWIAAQARRSGASA